MCKVCEKHNDLKNQPINLNNMCDFIYYVEGCTCELDLQKNTIFNTQKGEGSYFKLLRYETEDWLQFIPQDRISFEWEYVYVKENYDQDRFNLGYVLRRIGCRV